MPDIFLDGGRVTSRDKSLLADGECDIATDAEYHPNDPALHKVPGRTAFNGTAESNNLPGLSYLEFDGSTDILLTQSGTAFRRANVGLTGSFGDVTQAGALTATNTAASLVTVHYNNRHVVLNGVDKNRRVKDSSDSVQTAALTSPPVVSTTTAYPMDTVSMTAPGDLTVSANDADGGFITLTATQSIDFWHTEQKPEDGTGAIRGVAGGSSPASDRVTITGPLTNATIDITAPVRTNHDASTYSVFASTTAYTTASGSNYPQGASVGTGTWSSTPAVAVQFQINTLPTGTGASVVFPVLQVTIAGATLSYEKYSKSLISTTGDIFEDSLAVNDSTDLSKLWYSFPDDIEAFPSVNFIGFETKRADGIKYIKALGNSLIVCLRNSMWRVDHLPRPEDSQFDRGKVKSLITGDFGAVGPNAGATFNFGQGERLAVITRSGIIVTDGFGWDVLTDDVDWDSEVEKSLLSKSFIINNPAKWRLEFYYPEKNGSGNSAIMYLNYHPSHAKSDQDSGNFRAKTTWPIHGKSSGATLVNFGGMDRVYTSHISDKTVYREGDGLTDAAGDGGITFKVRTKEVYGANKGNQSEIERVWARHGAYSGQTATVTLTLIESEQSDVEAASTISLTRNELTGCDLGGMADAHQFKFENSDSSGPVNISHFTIQGENYGESREP